MFSNAFYKAIVDECAGSRTVLLGVGPALAALPFFAGSGVVVLSENGIVGMESAGVGVDASLIDAGRNRVALAPGGAMVDSVDMFSLIRSGRLDAAVVGALEVDRSGAIAAHMGGGDRLFGYGGAMDIYGGAKKVIAAVQDRKLVERLSLPATARAVVNVVITEKRLLHVDTMVEICF